MSPNLDGKSRTRMVTPASQRRILADTENAIRVSDPGLASILDLFGRLNRDEEMPLTEQLADRGRLAARPEPNANYPGRLAAIAFFVFVAAWISMLVIAGTSAHPASCPAVTAYAATSATACKLTAEAQPTFNPAHGLRGGPVTDIYRHLPARPARPGSADWRDQAACRDMDPELFFPVGNAGPALLQIDRAKQVCEGCPVRTPCLQWALDSGQEAGVWGGTSEDERRALRSRRMYPASVGAGAARSGSVSETGTPVR